MERTERRARKKLAGAAQHWLGVDRPKARPVQLDEETAEVLRRLKAPEEQIQAALDRAKDDVDNPAFDFEVEPDCWDAVMLFCKLGTQWIWRTRSKQAGLGFTTWSERAGLSYPGVESGLRMAGVPRREWAQLLEDFGVMERAILDAQAKAG